MGDGPTEEKVFSIKCSLGRLRPSPEVRAGIENIVEKIHAIALRGSYVATETWLASPPDALPVVDQTWWRQCFSSCLDKTRLKNADIAAVHLAAPRKGRLNTGTAT